MGTNDVDPTRAMILDMGVVEPGELLDPEAFVLVHQIAADFGRLLESDTNHETLFGVIAALGAVRAQIRNPEDPPQSTFPEDIDKRSYMFAATSVLLQVGHAYIRRQNANREQEAASEARAPIRRLLLNRLKAEQSFVPSDIYKLTDGSYDREEVHKAMYDLVEAGQVAQVPGSPIYRHTPRVPTGA